MLLVVRDYPFHLYKNKETEEQVMAGAITEDQVLHLAEGEVTYSAGDYEIVTEGQKVCMMHKDEFEEKYVQVETPKTLEVNSIEKGGE